MATRCTGHVMTEVPCPAAPLDLLLALTATAMTEIVKCELNSNNWKMEFSDEEIKVQQDACENIKSRKDELIQSFIIAKRPINIPFTTIFMAGSPGAGKTEFAKRYIPLTFDKNSNDARDLFKSINLKIEDFDSLLIRIDVDEVREFIPQYKKTDRKEGTKGNAHVIQKAANKGLDFLREYCFKHTIPFLHDGTFGNLKTMRELVSKSIKLGRVVRIYYLYLDPLKAWEFTKAREFVEGRNILKEKFVEQFFASKLNVETVKEEFGDSVVLDVIVKDQRNDFIDLCINSRSIDSCLNIHYKKGTLIEYSKEELEKVLV